MTTDRDIDIFKVLDFIRDHAPEYAQAKANRVHLEEFRKSKKALLMRQAEIDGHKAAVAQEREAYAHPEYLEVLQGLKAAVEQEESLRWLIVAAQAKFEAWRSLEANKRHESKIV